MQSFIKICRLVSEKNPGQRNGQIVFINRIKANKIHTFFQPKRKKRGRPAKNAKNDDEESENSQNLPPASAENSKSLPPAPADETSVVNDNKIQVFFSLSN